jgi:hypothetical protein
MNVPDAAELPLPADETAHSFVWSQIHFGERQPTDGRVRGSRWPSSSVRATRSLTRRVRPSRNRPEHARSAPAHEHDAHGTSHVGNRMPDFGTSKVPKRRRILFGEPQATRFGFSRQAAYPSYAQFPRESYDDSHLRVIFFVHPARYPQLGSRPRFHWQEMSDGPQRCSVGPAARGETQAAFDGRWIPTATLLLPQIDSRRTNRAVH